MNIKRGTKSFILITVFLNFTGIGIINPVSPFIVEQVVSQEQAAFVLSLLFTSFALCQFMAIPVLGVLSDRFGRRPVLLISLFGSAVGYWIFGIGGALFMLFLGRMIDGLTGGNIATIHAYAADITEPKDRTHFFGLIGAASGAGFVLGPALGGLIYRLTDSYVMPFYLAALVTLLNTLWGVFAARESLPVEKRSMIQLSRMNPLTQLIGVFRLAQVRWLLMWAVAFTMIQATFSYMVKDRLGWTPDTIGISFLLWGVISIIVQAFLIRRLVPLFGELKMMMAGLGMTIISFAMMALVAAVQSATLIWLALPVAAVGGSLVIPALAGLLSQSVDETEQGRVQGGGQAVQALARIIGPMWGGFVYQEVGSPAPFLSAVFGLTVLLFIVIRLYHDTRTQQVHEFRV